ncbi:MAG: hypothetical protein NVS4B11_30850 [Ktedonobacteraceae bacterium]
MRASGTTTLNGDRAESILEIKLKIRCLHQLMVLYPADNNGQSYTTVDTKPRNKAKSAR